MVFNYSIASSFEAFIEQIKKLCFHIVSSYLMPTYVLPVEQYLYGNNLGVPCIDFIERQSLVNVNVYNMPGH